MPKRRLSRPDLIKELKAAVTLSETDAEEARCNAQSALLRYINDPIVTAIFMARGARS